jgi:DNA-binding NtrC family response regulator
VPPLRDRGEDVLLLAQHFLAHAGRANARAVGGVSGPESPRELTLDLEAAAELRRYPWPGNVRELRHAIESVAVLCPDGVVSPAHLPNFLRQRPSGAPRTAHFTLHLDGREQVPFADVVHEVEQALLQWALAKAAGQQTRAAEILGLARTTLQSKLHHEET